MAWKTWTNGENLDSADLNGNMGKMFSGDGSDGAFSETAGTTNLVQGTVYEYTSFNLGVSATLSTASSTGEPIIVKVQGNCIIDGTINLEGKGIDTSGHMYICNTSTDGSGSENKVRIHNNGSTGEALDTDGGHGGIYGNSSIFLNEGLFFKTHSFSKVLSGTKGGAGGAGSSASGGSGGAGGGAIIFLVGGNITFGASSVINCKGSDGSVGGTSASFAAGGGGGGGGGCFVSLYGGSKTDSGATFQVTAGAGGTGGTGGSVSNNNFAGGGGGGGSSQITNGTGGVRASGGSYPQVKNGGAGGAGGAGYHAEEQIN